MTLKYRRLIILFVTCLLNLSATSSVLFTIDSPNHHSALDVQSSFPRSLESYQDSDAKGVIEIIQQRIQEEPFNLVATILFLLAIIHTFLASKITSISHRLQHEHQEQISRSEREEGSVNIKAETLHFLGEVEVIFGLWLIPLIISIIIFYDWTSAVNYFHDKVDLCVCSSALCLPDSPLRLLLYVNQVSRCCDG